MCDIVILTQSMIFRSMLGLAHKNLKRLMLVFCFKNLHNLLKFLCQEKVKNEDFNTYTIVRLCNILIFSIIEISFYCIS